MERADRLVAVADDIPGVEHPDVQFARMLRDAGDFDGALERVERRIERARETGDWHGLPRLLLARAGIQIRTGAIEPRGRDARGGGDRRPADRRGGVAGRRTGPVPHDPPSFAATSMAPGRSRTAFVHGSNRKSGAGPRTLGDDPEQRRARAGARRRSCGRPTDQPAHRDGGGRSARTRVDLFAGRPGRRGPRRHRPSRRSARPVRGVRRPATPAGYRLDRCRDVSRRGAAAGRGRRHRWGERRLGRKHRPGRRGRRAVRPRPSVADGGRDPTSGAAEGSRPGGLRGRDP